jgi:hypothetical protein
MVESVIDQLGQRRADAMTTLELLDGYRQQVETQSADLENPQAVSEYVAFFIELIGHAVAECERIAGELPSGIQRAHIEVLHQIGRSAVDEQRRCLFFRDKCINRPLRHERMRPLLNDISITTRDQLTAFRDLNTAAERLESLLATDTPPPDNNRAIGRRQLFTRLFRTER